MWIKSSKNLPELPGAKRARFVSQYGLSDYDGGVLTSEQELADWFEAGAKLSKSPKGFANWIMGDMAAKMKEAGLELKDLKFDQKKLCELVDLIDSRDHQQQTGQGSLYRDVRPGCVCPPKS